eukprot:scaffold26718_cov25-Prasinocladus_malaysianus.AAC.1
MKAQGPLGGKPGGCIAAVWKHKTNAEGFDRYDRDLVDSNALVAANHTSAHPRIGRTAAWKRQALPEDFGEDHADEADHLLPEANHVELHQSLSRWVNSHHRNGKRPIQ